MKLKIEKTANCRLQKLYLYNLYYLYYRYLDTIDSDTGDLNTISALNLIVFGPKLEHLDLIEYVVVDLLKVKWQTFIKREFFKQMIQFTIFFALAITAFIIRPVPPESECSEGGNMTMLNGTWLNQTNLTSLDLNLGNLSLLLLNSNVTNATCEEEKTTFQNCYLHEFDEPWQQVRIICEVLIVFFGLLYLLKAAREFSFLGKKVFLENMALCPSRVCFLVSCLLLQVFIVNSLHIINECLFQFTIPARIFCLYIIEDIIMQIVMLSNGLYFLFFCRGFKLVGPMVIMIYRFNITC